MTTKRSRGAPDKATALKNKDDRAKAKIIEQKVKSKELLAENYHEYMEILHKVAMNTLGREVTITNQVSTLKFMISLADEVLKEDAKKNTVEEEGTQESPVATKSSPEESISLIAYDFGKKAAGE